MNGLLDPASLAAPAPAMVPCLPETAPFTPEQRAYLNGFLAGLFSRAPALATHSTPAAPPPVALRPLTILFGSQTGNSEALAKRAAKAAGQRGFAPMVYDLAQYDPSALPQERQLLLLTSTYGDGEPPDNAKSFLSFLNARNAPVVPQLRFAVCGLGDTHYEKFCQCAKDFDRRLAELRAQRVVARVDCDVEYETAFQTWLDAALKALGDAPAASADAPPTAAAVAVPATPETAKATARPAWSRARPFPGKLAANRLLSGSGSAKETRHFEISIADSGLSYEAGDALGVVPCNCPALVEDILVALGCDPETPVPGADGKETPLRHALIHQYEITRIPVPLLRLFAERSGDAALRPLVAPGVNGELDRFLWGREIIDLLLGYPQVRVAPGDLVGCLRKLAPRLYSIASSPRVAPDKVHLTVGIVRFESLGRARKGVCSSFLADRLESGAPVPVFVQPNPNFRPPKDPARAMIMVGPGTGIAPFRGFLQQRQATGARGQNWLFFGDQHAQTDFLYRDELEAWVRHGSLTRLSTAFSRDQADKVYVQNRMLEQAELLFAWLEEGAHFYVCGDAKRMARDVDAALHQVIVSAGGRTPEQAAEYVARLKTEKRYQRDVY